MSTTQVACPHCGSTLNFGAALEAGAAVECLICMRTFTPESTVCDAPAAAETLIIEKGADELRPPDRPIETGGLARVSRVRCLCVRSYVRARVSLLVRLYVLD
jgi:hypothetical protein